MDKLREKKLSKKEREERLQYLKGMFRLSFRTNLAMLETLNAPDSEFSDDEDDYDCVTDFAYDEPSRGDEEEMAEFRADFKAIDAEDVFIQLCIDYYQDVLAEMKQRQNLNQWQIDTYRAYADAIPVTKEVPTRVRRHGKYYNLPSSKERPYTVAANGFKISKKQNSLKKPSHYEDRIKEIAERIDRSQQHQKEVEAQITALQKELAQIKGAAVESDNAATKPNKLTKLAKQQAVALATSPELTKWQTVKRTL